MITFYSTVGNVEDEIMEKIENEGVYADDYQLESEELDEDSGIIASGIRVVIPKLGVSARSGMFLNCYEDEDELVPDFSITLIYEQDETDPSKFLYWEQDDIAVSLCNYLRNKNISMNDIYDCECTVEIDDGE